QDGKRYSDFLAAYKEKFGSEPDALWVLPGYDVVMVLAQAMEEAGTTDGAEVAKAMESMTFDCLTGELDWADAAGGHEPNKAAAVVKLDKGVPSFIGWRTPEFLPAP
ncbi:MAG: ABC transporter substrate-binding protein, partial [Actinomycetota bacterium]